MSNNIAPIEGIENKIYIIRGKRVMLDRDLAELYGVKTGRLNEQVRRNIDRFPKDFMFQLTQEEASRSQSVTLNLRSQFVTSNQEEHSRSQYATLKRGQNIKYLPYVFTEQGVAMLSSVLKSKRAIQVNIQIMRIFVKIKEMLSVHKELSHKLERLEQKVGGHDVEIRQIFDAIKQLMEPPQKTTKKIGFV